MALTKRDREQIAEILHRRANEIAVFRAEYTKAPVYYGSVELALTREIERLRELERRVAPKPEGE